MAGNHYYLQEFLIFEERRMNNEAMQRCMKGLAARFGKAAEGHRAMSECHQGLSACMKTIVTQMKADGVGFGKSDKGDYHQELAQQHSAMADHMDACAGFCKTASELPAGKQGGSGYTSDENVNLDGDQAAKIATTVIDTLRKEFGEQVVPSMVKGVVPDIPEVGLQLVGRTGGMATPTDAAKLGEFADLFRE
jgi:hypothetical protein